MKVIEISFALTVDDNENDKEQEWTLSLSQIDQHPRLI